MARCGCGDTGAAAVRSLLSASNGINYNSLTGNFTAHISTQPGNNLTIAGDNGLYVPTGSATVTTGAGLTGNGSGPSPVAANVSSWPYPTTAGTQAQGVFVDPSTNKLISPPSQQVDFVSSLFDRSYANLAVAAGTTPVTADSFTVTLANPDPNRSCVVIIWREVKMRFTLPANSTASYSIASDDTGRYFNNGTTSQSNMGVQTAKSFKSTNLGPGATSSYTLTVGSCNGTGGATYSRIEVAIRVLYISI